MNIYNTKIPRSNRVGGVGRGIDSSVKILFNVFVKRLVVSTIEFISRSYCCRSSPATIVKNWNINNESII